MNFIKKTSMLLSGLLLYSLGIALTIQANIGLAPWDVFHQGISKHLHINIGQAAIILGILIVILNVILGEKVGWGTVSNGLTIGLFLDFILNNDLLPTFTSLPLQYLMATVGMFIIGIASSLYIRVGLGAGPRDGLMMALTRKTNLSVRLIRSSIELSVLIVGIILGGSFGFGTIFMGLTIGYFVQLAFKLTKFDGKKIRHRYITDDIKQIRQSM